MRILSTQYSAVTQFFNDLPVVRRRRFRTDGKVPYVGAHPLYSTFSRRGLLDPTKLANDPRCRKSGS